MRRPDRRALWELVRSGSIAATERDLARFEEEVTILAADSSGFSRKTFEHGIVRFLANMTRVYDKVVPLIERHGGVVTTQNADNVLAIFSDTEAALRAAAAVHALLARRDARARPEDRFQLCIGVHVGRVLRLRDDVFGGAVNVCAKIGEDVADAGETLVTDAVVERIGRERFVRAGTTTVGGRRFRLWRTRD